MIRILKINSTTIPLGRDFSFLCGPLRRPLRFSAVKTGTKSIYRLGKLR
jgi:hypothetical protein